MKRKFFLLFICFWCLSSEAQKTAIPQPKGSLFIIGGGEINDTLRSQLLKAANWKKGDLIAVVSLASTYDSSCIWMQEAFKKLTGETALCIDSASVRNEAVIKQLVNARLIYFGGGDQARIMKLSEGTNFKQILINAYYKGATIAGTSAGASVMSKHMLTGDSYRDNATPIKHIWNKNVELKEGLGLLEKIVIDQHFVIRSRFNRLFTVVMEHPELQYIAIDESTAIWVKGNTAMVFGESQVIVAEKPKNIKLAKDGRLTAQDIRVSFYAEGNSFTINN